jgi:hypothetical protein
MSERVLKKKGLGFRVLGCVLAGVPAVCWRVHQLLCCHLLLLLLLRPAADWQLHGTEPPGGKEHGRGAAGPFCTAHCAAQAATRRAAGGCVHRETVECCRDEHGANMCAWTNIKGFRQAVHMRMQICACACVQLLVCVCVCVHVSNDVQSRDTTFGGRWGASEGVPP